MTPPRSRRPLLGLAFALTLSSVTCLTFANDPWRSVPLGGGGFVSGILSDSEADNLYIRTDVGGVFRWDASNQGWQNLTDLIVPANATAQHHLLQTAAMAIDPQDSNKLYIAVGSPYRGNTGGIFSSNDRGLTWTRINGEEPVILVDGNGGARGFGERLAVDPNNPRRLWFGSTLGGLYCGEQNADGWTWHQIPPTSLPTGLEKVGINFVVCDPANGSTIVYAGVFDNKNKTGGVYRTTNGIQWDHITGINPTTPARASLAKDGTLIVTSYEGVAKLSRGGAFIDITPEAGKKYRALATSSDARNIYVAEILPGTSTMWRSNDGGESWTRQNSVSFNNRNVDSGRGAIPTTEPDGTPTLTGYWHGNVSNLWLNPRNPNELWAADFFGVSRTLNADLIGGTETDKQPLWHRLQVDQEETVVLDLKSPPAGASLLTGLADVGGARYVDPSARPTGNNGNTFSHPSGGNVTSLDFCESEPNIWVRAWGSYQHFKGTGGVSLDQGANWMLFGQVAGSIVEAAPADGIVQWDVTPYLAGQQSDNKSEVTLMIASKGPWPSSEQITFDSRESAADGNQPMLVINGIQTIPVSADSFVSERSANTNFNDTASLNASGNIFKRWIYLRFSLKDAPPIMTATLRLHRTDKNQERTQIAVYASADTAWQEDQLTAKNAPDTYGNSKEPFASIPTYVSGSKVLHAGRIAISAKDPNRIVWASAKNVPYVSEDRGVTFKASTGAPATNVSGIYTDGGSLGIEGQCLAADRVNGRFYFADLGHGAHVIYRSDDGHVWTKVSSVDNGYSYNMRTPQLVAAPPSALLPEGGDVWLCDDGSYNKKGGGLWRSTDGCTTWTKLKTAGKTHQVAFGRGDSDGNYTVFIHGIVNGKRGVYQSKDYGETWSESAAIPTLAGITSLAGDRQKQGRVFIGTTGRGVFVHEP